MHAFANPVQRTDGYTALIIASEYNHPKCVQALLQPEHDVESKMTVPFDLYVTVSFIMCIRPMVNYFAMRHTDNDRGCKDGVRNEGWILFCFRFLVCSLALDHRECSDVVTACLRSEAVFVVNIWPTFSFMFWFVCWFSLR